MFKLIIVTWGDGDTVGSAGRRVVVATFDNRIAATEAKAWFDNNTRLEATTVIIEDRPS